MGIRVVNNLENRRNLREYKWITIRKVNRNVTNKKD